MIKNASIKVAVKIKPTPTEKLIATTQTIQGDSQQVMIKLPSDQVQTLQVDLVHDANTTKKTIYQSCQIRQLIGKFLQGYNITVLTYGQTGSGKTFAFEGDKQNEGIIFRSIQDIFMNRPSQQSVLKCSFIQIYNEKISDMLLSDNNLERGLKIRWQVQRQFVIQDLTEKECLKSQDMIKEWNLGNKNRVVACNKIHDYSSRSHSLFIITLEDQDQQKNYRVRQAHFVDLAGSERVFSPVGRLSKESIEINKSLFFLRKVIITLEETNSHKKQQYIPYRDSKLTSILKKSFGGNCLTLMIACINGHEDYLQQSLSTLQYAVSASKIRNQVNVNIDLKSQQIKELKIEKQKLKKELQMATMQIEMFKSMEREEDLKRASNNEYANRIIECIGTVRELLKSNKQLRNQLDREKADKKKLGLDLQQLQKNYKKIKRAAVLQPVEEIIDHRMKQSNKEFRIFPQPVIGNGHRQNDKAPFSQSVDLQRKKQRRQSSVIRRKKYLLYDGRGEKGNPYGETKSHRLITE